MVGGDGGVGAGAINFRLMKQHAKFLVRGMTLTVAALVTSTAWAQQEAAPAEPETETAESAPTQETPIRQPPSNADAAGAPPPTKVEKLVLADPDSKMYMPCRDPNAVRLQVAFPPEFHRRLRGIRRRACGA